MSTNTATKTTKSTATKATSTKAKSTKAPAKKVAAPKAKRFADGDLEHSVFGRDIVVLAKPGVQVKGTNIMEAAHAGQVAFFKVRDTKGTRRWPVLAPESKARLEAAGIRKMREDGKTVKEIAKAMNVSISTVRRSLTALAFTENLEAASATRKAALAKKAIVVKDDKDQQKVADKEAEKSQS